MAKRVSLSIKQKHKIIEYFKEHKNLTHSEIAVYFTKKFNLNPSISRRTVGDIIANETKIVKLALEHRTKMRRIRKVKNSDLENQLSSWITNVCDKNFILTEDFIKTKAVELSKKLKIVNFQPSNGWLHNFKKRNNICLKTLSGEIGGININDFEKEKDLVIQKIEEYMPGDVFNMDETGLMFREIPSKSLSTNNNSKGYKKLKERLTILLCCNLNGTEKLNLTIIGKSKKPRSFRNFDPQQFCNYIHTKKAWLNIATFENWIYDLNSKMKSKKEKSYLF